MNCCLDRTGTSPLPALRENVSRGQNYVSTLPSTVHPTPCHRCCCHRAAAVAADFAAIFYDLRTPAINTANGELLSFGMTDPSPKTKSSSDCAASSYNQMCGLPPKSDIITECDYCWCCTNDCLNSGSAHEHFTTADDPPPR